MNFKQKFLTLSIRHQISIVIIILSIFCFFSILGLFLLYSNIIINIRSRKRKDFYYQKYKGIVTSNIEFQTFLLFQYEELIQTFNMQTYYFGVSVHPLFDSTISYKENIIKMYQQTTDEDYKNDLLSGNHSYYLLFFSNDTFINYYVFYTLSLSHLSLNIKIDSLKNCRIPYFGKIKVLNDYVLIHYSERFLISVNRTKISEIFYNSKGNYSAYYSKLNEYYTKKYKYFMSQLQKAKGNFFDLFYKDKFDILSNYLDYQYSKDDYLDSIVINFHFINYDNGLIYTSDHGNIKKLAYIQENSIINDYLNILFNIAKSINNADIIPVFPENNTIMSVNLCYGFLYRQLIYINLTEEKNIFNEEKLNEIYNRLKKGESNIGDCILDKKYNFDTGQNAYDILNIVFNQFYTVKNNREFTLFKLSETQFGNKYVCGKYTFPDTTSLLNFNPKYFIINQLNIYTFHDLMEPKHYEDNISDFYLNCQFLIVLCLLYLWVFIIIYLVFRLKKLFIEIIDPINNLIKMINNLELNEDNLLKYESDDTINELFQLCNELLLGKYKQKMIHDSELEKNIEMNDNKNINDYNNLKINIKLIEELIENKNEYNIKGDEIIDFRINEYLNKRKIMNSNNNNKLNSIFRKTTIIKKTFINHNNNQGLINDIQTNIKKTNSINNTISILNKKKSFDINLIKTYENLITHENKNEEDRLELEILLNYKNLYDIIDLAFNYEIKADNILICKASKLLYQNNISNYNKYSKLKIKRKPTSFISATEEKTQKSTSMAKSYASEKEIKDNAQIKIEDFYKSVMNAYDTKNILFLWYEEAKYFKGEEFLQNNHSKEMNNLFMAINEIANKKPHK